PVVSSPLPSLLVVLLRLPPPPPPFPYTTLFRSRGPERYVRARAPRERASAPARLGGLGCAAAAGRDDRPLPGQGSRRAVPEWRRSEEHTSELQSRFDLVCRLLLEKKNIAADHLR